MSGKFGGGGKKCAICSKTTYTAETIVFEKIPYHIKCFRCTECTKKMTLSTAKTHEEKFYCSRCYNRNGWTHAKPKVTWTKKETKDGEPKATTSSKYGGGGTPCTLCKKTVFNAEALNYEKKTYHAECFKCTKCGHKIKSSNAAAYEENIYCRKCFAGEGYNRAQTQSTKNWKSSGAKSGGGSGRWGGGGVSCSACEKKVYGAENVPFEKKNYHAKCFKCKKCNKKLAPGNAAKYDDETTGARDIYCKKCFKELGLAGKQAKTGTWVPKASSGGGASGKFGGGGKKCYNCSKTVYNAEAVTYEKKVYHEKCFVCSDCPKKLTQSDAKMFENKIYCPKCWGAGGYAAKQAASAKTWKASETKDSGGSSKFHLGGGGSKCCHCSKTVYQAEHASFEKHIYHQKCLICTDCNTKTALKNLNMYQEKLKCAKCWKTNNYKAKQAADSKAAFEAKQAKQAEDGTTTETDSRFKNFGGGALKCYICQGALYSAEAISFEKQSYHSKCFTCANTADHEEPLKLTTSSASYKKDSEGAVTIYCSTCFHTLGLNRAELN